MTRSIEALGITAWALDDSCFRQKMKRRIQTEGMDATEVEGRVNDLCRNLRELTPRFGSDLIGKIVGAAPSIKVLEEVCREACANTAEIFKTIIGRCQPSTEAEALAYLDQARVLNQKEIRSWEFSVISKKVTNLSSLLKILPSLKKGQLNYLHTEEHVTEELIRALPNAKNRLDWGVIRLMPTFDLDEWDSDPINSPASPHFFTVRIARWDRDPLYGNQGEEGQTLYGDALGKAIAKGAKLLKQRADFPLLTALAARERGRIARERQHNTASSFGRTRQPDYIMRTPLMGRYEDLGDHFLRLSPDKLASFATDETEDRTLHITVPLNAWEPPIELTRIELSSKSEILESGEKHYIYHICRNIEPIMDHVRALLSESLAADTDAQAVVNLGTCFWWLCQAKPWLRGDPSIAEILVKSVMLARGIQLRPWKAGTIPWAEVIKNPDPIDFGRHFTELFDCL